MALCRRLPKVELHAHLHGSARLCTIADLAPPGVDQALLTSDTERSLEGCFAIFGAIHRTVTTLAAVRRITAEVLSDFAAENVKYLEMRTTPRALADADIEGYVRAVLDVFEQFELAARDRGTAFPLVPRLILSIDRSGDLAAAHATVALASRLRAERGVGRYVVGIDFSGNPTVSGFAQFAEAFAAARDAGLHTVVHAAEVAENPNP